VLHLVNLTAAGSQAPLHELVPVGPLQVRLPASVAQGRTRARSLVSGIDPEVAADADGISFTVPAVLDHEVIVLEPAESAG
jgi:hypothetical protein